MSSLKRWGIIIIFGFLLCIIYAFGSFTLDYYAGAATLGVGIMGRVSGVGMFFIYILGFYISLVVVLPILIIKRFGVGVAIYLPYAIAGLFVEYYMEWLTTHALVSVWAVVGWCVIGLVTGLSADLAYWLLPSRVSERWRAITTGVVLVIVTFLLVLLALTFFYVERQKGPGSFLGIAYYGLPLLILNGGFGGYTAYAISRHV